mmetsp:Transcript_21219/g.55393  ORF Transcript_21219/g.55393 Transcript_21219/m.55393 type:complete len:351 (-) Transcript_21219:80-1132(-)
MTTAVHKTTAVRLTVKGKERDLTRITPTEYLELSPKQVRECTEVYMGEIGLEKIRGFEKLKNLECVWLNNNKLKYINNLDINFRIKVLYAQYNDICSLKGSLAVMSFLNTLDLSHNNLRDLEKLLTYLEKYKFLKHLNLKGNPCCEEPDYRLHVIHRIPSVHVLDQHVVTDQERFDARTQIGGDISALTIAFGKRIPMPEEWWMAKVEPCTAMEKACNEEAATLRRARAKAAQEAELRLFEHDPSPPTAADQSPPPPPGWTLTNSQTPAGLQTAPSKDGRRRRPEYVPKDRLTLFTLAKGEQKRCDGSLDAGALPQDGKITLNPRKLATFHAKQDEAERPTVVRLTQRVI